MKKFLVGITVLLFGIVLVVNYAFAALSPLGTTWSADDTREVNRATPGTDKAFLGTYAQGPVGTMGATTYSATNAGCPALAGGVATPTTTAFLVTSGSGGGQCYRLGAAVIPGTSTNAVPTPAFNQELTITLVTDGGKDFVVTPVTKTGFTDVTFNDAKDSATLKYIDTTTGWVVTGNNGATVN